MKTTTKVFRNKRNEHKFIEVHNDGHYHNTVRQFMHWKTESVNVKNLLGDRCLHRWRAQDLRDLLEDYVEVKDYQEECYENI